VIRQAISCDICGSEKKQTNHWFVAYDQGGELRLSGWSSRNKLRPGTKHLCGQTCLHKLVDEFMARILAQKPAPHGVELPDSSDIDFEKYTISERTIDRTAEHIAARAALHHNDFEEEEVEIPLADTDASLTSKAAFRKEKTVYAEDFESSARLIPHPATGKNDATEFATPTILPPRKSVELVAVSTRKRVEETPAVVPPEEPRFASRNWRAEAWEREREREMRQERHTASSIRRRH